MFEYWQENPEMKTVFNVDFIRQLRDYTFFKIAHDNLNHNTAIVEEWNALKTNALSKAEAQKYQFEIDAIEFLSHLARRDYSKIETSYSKVKTNLTSINLLPISQRITIFYHITVYHFFKKEYSKAWSFIKKIDALGSSQLDPHIMKYVRLIELIVQYELEDQEVEYRDIKNIRSQLNSIGALGKVEDILLEVMNELIDIPKFRSKSETDNTINKLLEHNQSILKQHPNSISHQILNVWINDKIRAERKYA